MCGRRRISAAPANRLSRGNEPRRVDPTRQILDWAELAEWQREDSSHVQRGYRQATPSLLQCLFSWAYLHNETVNIFSHLLGAVVFLGLPGLLRVNAHYRYAVATTGELAVFAIYLFGVAGCYTLSVLFHTLTSHSARGFTFGIQLDFQGIILLIWSATVPLVYYTFYAEPTLQKIYWAVSSVLALLASVTTFTPAFHKPATKPLRATVFGSLALSTLAGVIHGLIVRGWDEQTSRFPMWAVGGTLLFNTLGAITYVLRFPERRWPRTFDIVGASHQLMHVCILIASVWWLVGMIKAFDHVHPFMDHS